MNARKARLRKKARERSQTSSLASRAKRIVRREGEDEIRAQLAVARGERDAALHLANTKYEAAIVRARNERAEERKEAYDAFEAKRTTILKPLVAAAS